MCCNQEFLKQITVTALPSGHLRENQAPHQCGHAQEVLYKELKSL